jgi:hypothetical protein
MPWRVLIVAALLTADAGRSAAIDLESLVMPGEVIEGHAEVEKDCTKCHEPFDRQAENGLCLECHEEVEADLRAGEGFHGKSPGLAEAQCRTCHTDHKGRDADILGLNPATFDHALTDYPLHGAHVGVACESCHPAQEKHREAPIQCVECHRPDDPHLGRLGDDCADCHGEDTWGDARFDHSKTEFPLEGKHQDVACALCHPGERYENTAMDCHSCHELDDVHRGKFGPRCEDCHTADAWDASNFDHDRDTDYPLEGRHRVAACAACHTGILYQEELATDCFSCHRADDEHRGRNGTKCEQCHDAGGWATISFDHDRDTDFPLRGSHREARCEACHRGVLDEEELPSTCIGCHAADDVHQGQQGEDCAECHNEVRWEGEVFFDHDLTRFPLLGLHAVVACEECHPTAKYQDAETACSACHEDEFHRDRVGADCALCHNPNGWERWRFDHGVQTSFALHGAHEGVDCHACHTEPVKGEIRIPGGCHACHALEDVHGGRFGRDCSRCHGETSWEEIELGP